MRLFVDFMNLDPDGYARLNCKGTIEDLARQGIRLTRGQMLTIHDRDMEVDATIVLSNEVVGAWAAEFDRHRIRPVKRIDWVSFVEGGKPLGAPKVYLVLWNSCTPMLAFLMPDGSWCKHPGMDDFDPKEVALFTHWVDINYPDPVPAAEPEPDKLTVPTLINSTVEDLVKGLLDWDRREDEALPPGSIEDAIERGDITVDDIVAKFRKTLEDGLDDEDDSFYDDDDGDEQGG